MKLKFQQTWLNQEMQETAQIKIFVWTSMSRNIIKCTSGCVLFYSLSDVYLVNIDIDAKSIEWQKGKNQYKKETNCWWSLKIIALLTLSLLQP